jgi:hypothetical protein
MKRDAAAGATAGAEELPFRLEEATIDDLHAAIRAGRATCVAVVQRYIDRARAFNGVASALLTKDGAPVPATTGAMRAQGAAPFPHANGQSDDDPSRPRQIRRATARIRAHGADRV